MVLDERLTYWPSSGSVGFVVNGTGLRCPMRTNDKIAVDVLQCAVTHEPDSRIVGNVTSLELVQLVAPIIMQCPKCGAEAWVNIDCDLCLVCHQFSLGEVHGD